MSKRQQQSFTIDDLDISTRDNVTFCFGCLKPITIRDNGTRVLNVDGTFLRSMIISSEHRKSTVYNEQLKFVKKHGQTTINICFICEPGVKCSLKQFNSGENVSYFSEFVCDTIAYLQGSLFKIDKNSFTKGCMCLSTTVTDLTGVVLYNKNRHKSLEIVEGMVVTLRYAFRKYGCNLRTLPVNIFGIAASLRWKFSGMLTFIQPSDGDCQHIRRGDINNILEDILFEIWPRFTNKASSLEILRKSPNSACSACSIQEKSLLENAPDLTSYDSNFLLTSPSILTFMEHNGPLKNTNPVAFASMLCFCTSTVSIRSFSYYLHISDAFPLEFRECDIRRYYTTAILSHFRENSLACPYLI